MVPTVDTERYKFLVDALVMANYPVLLTGPVGTAKTSVAQSVLQGLDERWTGLTVNMSSQVCSPHFLSCPWECWQDVAPIFSSSDYLQQHPGHRGESN